MEDTGGDSNDSDDNEDEDYTRGTSRIQHNDCSGEEWSRLNPGQVINVNNVDAERELLSREIAELSEEQTAGFDSLKLHTDDMNAPQAILFSRLASEGLGSRN